MQAGNATYERLPERYALTAIITGLCAVFMINMAFLIWQLTGQPVFAWSLAASVTGVFGIRMHMTAIVERDVRTPVGWRDWLAFTLPTLVILRLVAGAFAGLDAGSDPLELLAGLGSLIFSIESMVLFGMLSASWSIAANMAKSVNSLCYRHRSEPPPRNTAAFYVWQAARALVIDRSQALEQIRVTTLVAAILVAFIAAGLILLPGAMGGEDAQLVPVTFQLPLLFGYFVMMFVTLSYANYCRNLATWDEAGTQVSEAIAPVWFRTSALVIGLGLLVATALPAVFVPNMEYFGGYLLKGVVLTWQLVTFPVFLVLALINLLVAFLFGGGDDEVAAEAAASGDVELFGATMDSITFSYLQGILAGLLLMIALYWLYRRSFGTSRPSARKGYQRLLDALLAFLWSLLRSILYAPLIIGRAAVEAIAKQRRRRSVKRNQGPPSGPPSNLELLWREFSLVISQGAAANVVRTGNQTALEFTQRLVSQLRIDPGPATAAAELFTRSRYDSDPVAMSTIERMRSLVVQVRSQIDEQRVGGG